MRARFFCVLILTLAALPAHAQLYDPNNRCVYQPGSIACQPHGAPPMPQTSGPPYQQFLGLMGNSNVDVSQHPTYTPDYFNGRSRTYCGLLQQGEMMKLAQEVQFPPVVHMTETTKDRPKLEVGILRIGTMNFCPNFWTQEQQWEATFVR